MVLLAGDVVVLAGDIHVLEPLLTCSSFDMWLSYASSLTLANSALDIWTLMLCFCFSLVRTSAANTRFRLYPGTEKR